MLWLAFCGALTAADLTSAQLHVAGTHLAVSPVAQTVPFDTPTEVETEMVGFDVAGGTLPASLRVVGEFSGPEIDGTLRLETVPGEPFRIPALRQKGVYELGDLRLLDGDELLAYAEPRAVSITATQILVTRVSTRALTLDEIRSHGIVLGDDSFQAFNLTVGFGFDGETIDYEVPIAYDIAGGGARSFRHANVLPSPPVAKLPPRFRPPQLVPFEIFLEQPESEEESKIPRGGCDMGAECRAPRPAPPMVGVVLFPNEIGLLHQFFSVVLMVQNGAPAGDVLEIHDLTARISLPSGLRQAETEPPTPLGVPVPMHVPGADGELGTADDLTILVAQATADAEFLVEGLSEGTHVVDFEMEGLLHGLPGGVQRLAGSARGSVIVRDPTLSVTINHPDVVRSDEEYDAYFTIANLGNGPVNGLSFAMRQAGLSGVELAAGESATRTVSQLLPGDSATVSFRMKALRTGKLAAATATAGSQIQPTFEFDMGVSDGVPLSPDSLLLPALTAQLDADLLQSAVGLLGLGHSLANAPIQVPGGLSRIPRDVVLNRAYLLAQAARHVHLGEASFEALAVLAAEWAGGRDGDWGWDGVRRDTTRGRDMSQRFGEAFQLEESSAPTAFERFARATHFLRPTVASVDGAGFELEIESRLNGRRSSGWGALAARDVPFAEVVPLDDATLAFVTRAEATGYRLVARRVAASAGSARLRVAVPGVGDADAMPSVDETVTVAAGGAAWIDFDADLATATLSIDDDGDGQAESTVPIGLAVSLAPRPFEVVTATVNTELERGAHTVDLLLSSDAEIPYLDDRDPDRFEIRPAGAGAGSPPSHRSNGGSIPTLPRRTDGSIAGYGVDDDLAPALSQRVIRVGFDNPISPYEAHDLLVRDIQGVDGRHLAEQTVDLSFQADRDVGTVVEGTIFDADGQPLPYATVEVFESELAGIDEPDGKSSIACYQHLTARVRADAEGRYRLPYVRQTNCSDTFEVVATAPTEPRRSISARGRVRSPGSVQQLDLRLLGRGTVRGTVRYDDGSIPDGLQVTAWNPVFTQGRIAWVGESGEFEATDVAVGTVQLTAWDAEGVRTYATVELPEAGAEVTRDLVLLRQSAQRVGEVAGRTLRLPDDGIGDPLPVPSAYVALYVDEALVGVERSDADGRFDFGPVPAGIGEIEAFDEATGRLGARLFVEVVADARIERDLLLRDDRADVQGHVYRRDGLGVVTPVADAIVYADGTPFHTRTDAAGFYRIEDIFAGEISIRAVDTSTAEIEARRSTVQAGATAQLDIYFEDEADLPGGVYGRVVDEAGASVAGAEVVLSGGYLSTTWHHLAITDADGSFAMADVAPGTFGVHALLGDRGGVAFAEVRFPGDRAEVTVRFRSATIRGRTVLADPADPLGGQPVSATVVYRHVEPYPAWGLVALIPEWRTLVTDGDGRFEIPDVHPGPYEIYAHNAFHGSVSLRGEIDEFSDELTFAFQPTGEIRGLVTLPDDATPAAGTTLSLRGGAFDDYEVVADAEGAFTFELVPPGYYSLTAEWRDGLIFRQKRVWVSVREPGDEVDVDLSLPTQARVVGRVEDASSQPVAGAVVTLRERAFPWRTLTANADGEGNYQFHNIFAGAVHVSAQAPQLGGLGGKATGEVIDEGLDVELPIVLEGAGAISGVVIDPGDGLPAASARIELSRGGLVDSLATDAEGRFHFDLLALGTYSLTIFDPSSGRHGFQDQLVLDAHGQHLETTVHLEVRGEVEGHLYNTPSLEGIPGATVRLDSRGLKWFTVFASTDVEGAYDFGGIPEGQFLLTGRSGDRRATGEGEIQEEDEVVVVDLYLEEPVRLTGRLYAPRHVNAPDGPDVLVDDAEIVVSQTSSGFVTGVSNDNPFVLDGLLPGFTRIQGRRLADDRTVYDTRRPEPGDALDVTLRLPGRGTLDIDVVDASGQPLDGAGLRLNGTSFTPEFQGHEVCAWGNGPLRWSHDFGAGQPAETTADVGAGPFSVVVEDLATGLSGSASGCLRYEGETVAVTVALQPSGSVAGQVFQVDGTTPAVGMLVVVDPSGFGWEPQFAETDADGRFRFDGLPLRSYQLSVEEPDGPGTFTLSAALATDGEVHDHSLVLDEVDPSVVAIAPAIGAVDQPLDVVAVIEFSEPIADCGDACWNLLNLRDLQTDGWPPIDHVFAADRRSVSLVPQQPLESARAYKIVVEAGLADFAGRKLGTRVVGGFTTADVLPPAVLSFAPAEGELQVAADRNLELTFTEPIDPASLGAAITLTDLATGQVRPVTSLLTHEDRRAVLTPIGGLATDTDYRLSVVGLRDGSGNTQTVESTVTFGTLDTQAPQIAWTQPTAGAAFTSGDEITAAVTTTDLRGTASVTFTIDEWSVTLDAEPWVWSVPAPLRAASESVDIRVEAVDVYGNVATSTRSIVVDPLDDPAAPTSAAGCPIDGDFVAPGVPLVVRFTAQDDLKLERVRLLVDGVEVDRQAPVDAAALEAGLAWTPDAAALAGDTFALVLESRDFAGNVTQIPLTVSVPTGEIVVGGAETPVDLVTGPGAVVLAAGLHALPLDVSRAGVLLLDGAELVAQPNTLLDSTSEMRLQCGASAALARVEAPTVVLETASVLAPLQLETLDLTAGLLEIEAGAALDASELGYVAWHHSPSLPFAPPWMEESLDRDGGSHGGAGGDRGAETVYDSVYRPTLAGGGGGRDFYFREGPSGGGIVRLDLGELRLEGAIRADAPDIPEGAIHDNAGVGAGGSIWIDATTVSGAGTVSASAGRSSRGAGGGGRVSLVVGAFSGFDPATQVEAVGGDNRLQTADGPNPDRDFASAGTVFVRTPGQSLGTLRIDNGRQDDGSPRRAPTTFLPALGVGSVSATQQDSGDLWVVSASDFLPRWRGAWMRLLDGAGGDLGTFEVDDLDGVRARLLGASSVTGAASFEGVYRFDELILAGHQTFDAADAIEVGTLSVGPEVTIHADIESASTELLAGAVLTVTEPVVADALTLRSGSTLRTVLGTPLVLDVAGRLTIEAGASLDADGLGHWYGTSATSFVGEVPAGLMGSAPTTGGSHGGQGTRDGAGEVFDSVYFPSELGGGGGGNSHDLLADGRDGFGGGLIVVDAGELVVDGRISARGRLGVEPGGAGGAGGSIRVRAGSLAGSGVIDVGGGASDIGYDAGAGGGGRILLDVDLLDGFDVASQALAHGGLPNTVVPTPAAAGTVLLRQPSSVHGTLYLANAPAPAGATLAVPTSLPRLGSGAVVAAVAVGADLQLTLDVPARVRWLGASIELFDAQGGLLATERVLDVIGGDLLVENAALFDAAATWRGVHRFDAVHLGEGVRLITDDTVDLGAAALGTEIELLGPLTARRLTLSAGAHLRSGDLEQPLRLEIAEDLIVEAGAVIEADGTGYGPTVTLSHRGLAPDGVLGAGEDNAGSHGGVGHPGADPGEIYDAIVHPILGGGGGGSGPTFNWRPRDAGGTGGGTLEIRAGSIQLDGEIRALGVLNGGDYDQGTGGAGGSIFVAAQSLAGTGAIDASGADGWTSGGGGGRIALQVADLSAFDVATQARAAGGVRDDNGTPSHRGGAGTVFVFDQSSVDGTLRVDGEETGSLEVGATPLPQIGDGIIGLVEADLQVPADAWIEPQDPAQMFSLGVFGMYVRVDGVDYRVLAEAGDRRRILLEGAAGVVAVGDAFRGVHAFDEVQAAGGAQLEFRDFDQVDTWTIDASSTVVRLDQNAPEIVSLTPADGSSFASGDLLGIVADLTDNTAVVSAVFELAGRSVTLTEAPWVWGLAAPRVTTTTDFVLRLTATDDEGNATIATRSIQVVPTIDAIAPTVAFGACVPGSMAVEPGALHAVSVAAGDENRLERVALLVDGQLVDERLDLSITNASLDFAWTVPAGSIGGTVHQITLRAEDYAGNATEAMSAWTVPPTWLVDGDVIDPATVAGTDLALGAGTFEVDQPLALASLTLMQGATLTTAAGVPLEVTTTGDAILECGSTVNVSLRGYAGGSHGATPPGAPVDVAPASRCTGGSHGGVALWHDFGHWVEGETYGSVSLPEHAGAGGSWCSLTGGRGGGVAHLAANEIELRGDIVALGQASGYPATEFDVQQGSGAGGSILLEANRLSGGGRLDASGGAGHSFSNYPGESPGGGGRVALHVDDLSAIDVATQVTASGGGAYSWDGLLEASAGPGTVFLFDSFSTYGRLRVVGHDVQTHATRLPALGAGTVGVADADTTVPADLWIEPLDPAARFALGATGAWMRIDGVDYRILDQVDRRRILLEGAVGAVGIGDAYRGVYKFDSLEVGPQDEVIVDDDLLEVSSSSIALSATVVAGTESTPTTLSVTFAGSPDPMHLALVDWGDGASDEPTVIDDGFGGGSFSTSHPYTGSGTFTISLCVEGTTAFACTTEQVAIAVDPPVVSLPAFDFATWQVEDQLDSGTSSLWRVIDGGASVDQIRNSKPTFFASPPSGGGWAIEGQLTMSSDDDVVGFAVGFDPGGLDSAPPAEEFLLVTWRRANLNLSGYGIVPKGLEAFLVVGEPENWWALGASPEATDLGPAMTSADLGWSVGAVYDLRLEAGGENVKLWIDGSLEFDLDLDVSSLGQRIAFYGNAQERMEFRDFARTGFVGGVGSPLTLELDVTDESAPQDLTATVDWGDGSPLAGASIDLDGRLTATHAYATPGGYTATVCATDPQSATGCLDVSVTVNAPAPPRVTFGEIDLSTFTAESPIFNYNSHGDGVWTVEAHHDRVVQSADSEATFFMSQPSSMGWWVEGALYMTGDNDDVGFVLGLEPGEMATGAARAGALVWKRSTENHGTWGQAPRGLRAFDLVASPVNWWSLSVAPEALLLAEATTVGTTGWDDDREIPVQIEYGGGQLDAWFDGTQEFSLETPNWGERLGFYSHLQKAEFRHFRRLGVLATAGTPASLEASAEAIGGLAGATATIDWGDGSGAVAAALDPATGSVSGSHAYATAGTYTATVCAQDVDGLVGCTDVAVKVRAPQAPKVSFGEIDLSTFTAESVPNPYPDSRPAGSWTIENGGAWAVENVDSAPTFFISPQSPEGWWIEGTLFVPDPYNDVGLAVGLDPGELASGTVDAAVFVWRQNASSYYSSLGFAPRGLRLFEIDGNPTNWWSLGEDLDASLLATAATLSDVGWSTDTAHLLRLESGQGELKLWVDDILQVSSTSGDWSDRFAFFANLAPPEFRDFRRIGLIAATGISVDLEADVEDFGGLANLTATVDWGDGSAVAAASIDTGSGQATASHVYAATGSFTATVCAQNAAGLSTCVDVPVLVRQGPAPSDPPTVTSLVPADGASFTSGDPIDLVAVLADDTGIADATLTLGSTTQMLTSAPWTLSGVAPIVSTVSDLLARVVVTDLDGQSTTVEHTLQIQPRTDTTAPTVAFGACGADGALVEPGVEQTLQLVAADDQLLAEVEWLVDGTSIAVESGLQAASRTTEAFWTVPAGAAGGTSYLVTVRATDYAGQIAEVSRTLAVPTAWTASGDPISAAAIDGTDWVLGAGAHVAAEALAPASLHLMRGATLTSTVGTPIDLEVTGVATLECGSAIDVTALGHAGGDDSVAPAAPVGVDPAPRCSGGAHGGSGAWHPEAWSEGETFGSLFLPEHAGGGGHGCAFTGGAGGGVVRLAATTLDLRGEILARGEDADHVDATIGRQASGAGGSILIEAAFVRGGGRLDASGGRTTDEGTAPGESAGGGGRVALYIDDLSQIDLATQVVAEGGGVVDDVGAAQSAGASGTVLAVDAAATHGLLRIAGPSVSTTDTRLPALGQGTIGVADADLVTPADLWVEPLDAQATFALGAVGAWLRIDDVDYRIVDQADRRRILLENASATVSVGDAYRGLLKLDALELAGSSELAPLDDLLEVADDSAIALTLTTVDGTDVAPVDLDVAFAGDPASDWRLVVRWGDGSSSEHAPDSESGGAGTLAVDHLYATAGSYTIDVCVTSSRAAACKSATVTVSTSSAALFPTRQWPTGRWPALAGSVETGLEAGDSWLASGLISPSPDGPSRIAGLEMRPPADWLLFQPLPSTDPPWTVGSLQSARRIAARGGR